MDQEESVAFQSQWHLWDIFRQINKGSNADQLEQEDMGIVTESATPGARPATAAGSHGHTPQELPGTSCCWSMLCLVL